MALTRTKHSKKIVLKEAVENPLMILRALNNRSFFHFLKFFWPEVSEEEFKPNWHIEYLCNQLQEVALRVAAGLPKEHDIIINIPPGTTKTTICMIMFPAWCWSRWYWMKFITVSYSATLSLESAEYSRDLIKSDRFTMVYPELAIKDDKDTKSNFRVVKKVPSSPGHEMRTYFGGNRYSTSVGGTLTGFHAHILLIDDPLNPHQAISPVELANTNRWIDQTLSTRKVDKLVSVTVLIMQRLHENDPSGHKLAKKTKRVIKHICLPGEIIAEGKDSYRAKVNPPELIEKYVDGLLDPVRLPLEALEDLESELGQYGYAGQVGQSPTPPKGGMFKVDHFQVIDVIPTNIVSTVRYWDKAGTADVLKSTGKVGAGAYTVGAKLAKLSNNQVVVLDVKRGHWSSEERERIIKETAIADGKGVDIYHEQEPGSGGKESAEATNKNLVGFVVQSDRPVGDKIYRADPYSVQVNNGNVLLLRGGWNSDFIEEHRLFPFSKTKDQVDAAGGAYSKLTSKRQVLVM